MRLPQKFTLVAAILSSTIALVACGDANVGSAGEFKTSGGDPSQDPAGTGTGGTTGGGGGGTNADAGSTGTSTTGTAGGFSVTLASGTLSSQLQATNTVGVTITPTNGFTGTVALTAAGLPTGVTATFTPASVDIGSGPGTSTMSLTVPSTVTPTTAAASITVNGSGDGGAVGNAPLALTVARMMTINIPVNVEAPGGTPFGTSPIVIHAGTISAANPIKISFVNKDTSVAAGHIVHSTNTQNGFFHGDQANPVPPNTADALRTITGTGSYPFYMHNEDTSIGNTITIMSP